MEFVNELWRNEFYELFFRGERRFGAQREADAGRKAKNMGINREVGLLIDDGSDDVCGFSAHAGQLDQFVYRHGYLAAELFDEHLCHADQVPGFVTRV